MMRRRLMSARDGGELKGNVVQCRIKPSDASAETRILGDAFVFSNVVSMTIDGNPVDNVKVYIFNDTNEHDVNIWLKDNLTNYRDMFRSCINTISIDFKYTNTSIATDMQRLCYGSTQVSSIKNLNTQNVSTLNNAFAGCLGLIYAPSIDVSNVTSFSGVFANSGNTLNLTIKNLGKKTLSSGAIWDFSGATKWGTGGEENRQSLIDSLITYSYDRASNGMETATIKLQANVKALLTADEIAQIEAKGYTLS